MDEAQFKALLPLLEEANSFAIHRARSILEGSQSIKSYHQYSSYYIEDDEIVVTYSEYSMGHYMGDEDFSISLKELTIPIEEAIENRIELLDMQRQIKANYEAKKAERAKEIKEREDLAIYEQLKKKFEK